MAPSLVGAWIGDVLEERRRGLQLRGGESQSGSFPHIRGRRLGWHNRVRALPRRPRRKAFFGFFVVSVYLTRRRR